MKTILQQEVDNAVLNFDNMTFSQIKDLLIKVQKEYCAIHYGCEDESEYEHHEEDDWLSDRREQMLSELYDIAKEFENKAERESNHDRKAYLLDNHMGLLELYKDMRYGDYKAGKEKLKSPMIRALISCRLEEAIEDLIKKLIKDG